MRTSETLSTAADLIETHGWALGSGWPGAPGFTGAYCIEGAIMAAAGIEWGNNTGLVTLWGHCPAYAAVRGYLDCKLLFIWQDSLPHDTGAKRVVAVLRSAALIEAAREEHAAKVDNVRRLWGDTAANALAVGR